jgi:hypothetical protein
VLLGLQHARDGEGASFLAGSSTLSTSSPIDDSLSASSSTDAEVSR